MLDKLLIVAVLYAFFPCKTFSLISICLGRNPGILLDFYLDIRNNIYFKMNKKNLIITFLLVGMVFQSVSQVSIGKIVSFEKQERAVLFKSEKGENIKVNIITDDIIRVQVSSSGQFNKSAMIDYGFVKDDFPVSNFDVKEENGMYKISTSSLNIQVEKNNFRLKFLDKEGNLILRNNQERGIQEGEKNVLNFDMPADEHFFGFGFMRKTLDARGHKLTFKRDYRWKEATLPFFMSTRGYAFYSNSVFNHDFDFTNKLDNGSGNYYSITTQGGSIDFYIIYGPDFPKLLDRYTELTGKTMMVPKWAFGLEYRLRYFGDQEELLSIAKEFRNKEIPADIMALEPGWEDVAYSMNWNWSSERFPNPKQMIDELGEMGFKLDLWESGVAPTKNITDPKTRTDWYAKRKDIIDMGVRMFKQDDPYPRSILSTELLDPVFANRKFKDSHLCAEELNNVANSLYSETLFKEFRKQTNERAVVMFHAYNASVASHRWPFQWAGDFQAENGMLNASLSGHAMVSYDIRNPYAAGWHQGFFTPFSVVDAWAYYREPWLYSESIEQSHRLYACLRSRLVPYLYSTLWQSHKTGLPIERPMVLNYHDDPLTHQMKSQFMVGDWFLLALSDTDDSPSGEKIDFWTGLQKGNHGRAYLPKGKWIDYWSGDVKNIKKAQWVQGEWPQYLGGLLYVKAGAIIPMGQVKNYIGEISDEVVVLDVFPHNKSSYQLYEDDGVSYNYENKAFAITDIVCEKSDNSVKLSISERNGQYKGMPENRTFLVKMHSLLKPKKIVVDGVELKFFEDSKQLVYSSNLNGWYYDYKGKKVIIKLDKGWSYKSVDSEVDPVATIPLTAKNERISWDKGALIGEKNREIIVELPLLAVAEFSSNIDGLPADGTSLANVNIQFNNVTKPISKLLLKAEGTARFSNGKKELEIVASDDISFQLLAGNTPCEAKVTISGDEIETSTFTLPVYGKPAHFEIQKANSAFAADNRNTLQFTAKLFDKGGRVVLESGVPFEVNVSGEAVFEKDKKTALVNVHNGTANFELTSTNTPGEIGVEVSYGDLKAQNIHTSSEKGEMQVRINPPEKIKLKSNGNWIPTKVDVFVNFKAGGKLLQNATNNVRLNVYSIENELLDTYIKNAKNGEIIFKDITYYKRPAQCLFEIKSENYETVTRKVFENSWDIKPKNKAKK